MQRASGAPSLAWTSVLRLMSAAEVRDELVGRHNTSPRAVVAPTPHEIEKEKTDWS